MTMSSALPRQSSNGASIIAQEDQIPSSLPHPLINEPPLSINGLARTTSKRRRASGTGPIPRVPMDGFSLPPAPEVPKPPPISYKPPHNAENYGDLKLNHSSPSFAERARILTGNSASLQYPEPDPEPGPQLIKPVRRGSLKRPIGGVYAEIQQHKRDSYPPPNGPISPRRFSSSTSPQQQEQIPPSHPRHQEPKSTINKENRSSGLPQAHPSIRRASAGPSRTDQKEWAPDRSPLQKLEIKLSDISKEEKRARVFEAEQRLRKAKGGEERRRSEGNRNSVVDRTSSKPVSATSGERTSRESRQYIDRNAKSQDTSPNIVQTRTHPPSDLQSRGNDHVPKAHKRRDSVAEGSYPEMAPAQMKADPNNSINRNDSRRSSARQSGTSQSNQQVDRGVRFQGQDGIEDVEVQSRGFNSPVQGNEKRIFTEDTVVRPNQTRRTQQDRLRQGLTTMTSPTSGKELPPQQNNLYSSKADKGRGDTSAATFGGVADPVPRHAVQTRGPAANYEVPPQTAAGIHAGQAVGFGSGPQGITETPAHRKHHLSEIIHRSHGHGADVDHEEINAKPRYLDEWRRAGTARLTASDFEPANESEQEEEELAWWERSRSGNRRKQGRPTKHEVPDTTGKSKSLSQHQASPKQEQTVYHGKARDTRTRQYIGEDEYFSRLKADPNQPHENHLAHFLHRAGHNQGHRLSSAYSYSCPSLAVHDPSHQDHICEPYLSKELTQSMRSIRIRAAPELSTFDPPLYLKCGPLLRYTGLKRDRRQMKARSGGSSSIERETWRGSVMIVTADADSSYDPVPTLRLFPEPMDILPAKSHRADAENPQDHPLEFVDPIAGLPKLSRSGRTVYVKPVDDLELAKDLSRLENDDGLFEETRTAAVPTAYGTPDFRASSANPKPVRRNEKSLKKGHQVKGIRLHAERGVTFWRFNLEVELGKEQMRIGYSINNSPSLGFWVPARGQSMNMMFHSCNGFSMSVNPDNFAGPDPLWRNVLNNHQTRPFHVMIGGGDQIYNDAVMSQCPLFRDWLELKNPHHKHEADFTPSLREELETFYLERYSMWFSQGLFGMANSQIPMVNMWDDHDIIDGFGSYLHHFMSTPVFSGVGAVAFKYYMLFQHQSVADEGSAEEPSWIMGASPGPYINQLSRSVFVSLGKNISLLAVDCRTERMREQVLSEASYDVVFDRCRREILEGETKHLIVLLGIPIAYPRLVWLENLLTSRVMDPVKYLGKVGMLGGFLNKFDGGVEILDDLDDHWTAKNHKIERNWFVQELQQLAAEKSIRVTLLGGDVHLAAAGQFYSNPKLKIPKDKDHRYMVNVVSSAIVNTPPPNNMADILNRRNKTHHLDPETDEDMIPMFNSDVNGDPRNNKRLLPRRNWCSIREYHPGSTPPPTPPSSESETESEGSPPPPTRLQRTLSLTRGNNQPANIIRRLSGRGPPPTYLASNGYDSGEMSPPESPGNDGYFPRQIPKRATTVNVGSGQRHSSAPPLNSSVPIPRPNNFHRRPTNISEKAAARGDQDDDSGHINLEHGLDIVLNCEVNQKDPAGTTVPYRLLIPALFYEGHGDQNAAPFRKKSLVSRLTSIRSRRRNTLAGNQGQGNYGQAESVTPSDSEGENDSGQLRPRRWSFGITQRRQYRDQTPPLERRMDEEREIGDEGTQKGRQFEHRSQQIGRPQQQPFAMPPRQQSNNSGLQSPSERFKAERGDSVDYHQHLDPSPPAEHNGYPGRRPSKVDRMLGVANLQRNPSTGGVSKIQRSYTAGNGYADMKRTDESPDRLSYESDVQSDDYEEPVASGASKGQRVSMGYSGIEAYSEKKGWRKWLDKAKEWEEKSSGRREKIQTG